MKLLIQLIKKQYLNILKIYHPIIINILISYKKFLSKKRPKLIKVETGNFVKDEIVTNNFIKTYKFLQTIYSIFTKNELSYENVLFFMTLRYYNGNYYKVQSLYQKPIDYSKDVTNKINDNLPSDLVRYKFLNLSEDFLSSQVYEIDALFEMIEPNYLINNFIYEVSNQKDLKILELSFQILHHFENYIKRHLQNNLTQLFLNFNIEVNSLGDDILKKKNLKIKGGNPGFNF